MLFGGVQSHDQFFLLLARDFIFSPQSVSKKEKNQLLFESVLTLDLGDSVSALENGTFCVLDPHFYQTVIESWAPRVAHPKRGKKIRLVSGLSVG